MVPMVYIIYPYVQIFFVAFQLSLTCTAGRLPISFASPLVFGCLWLATLQFSNSVNDPIDLVLFLFVFFSTGLDFTYVERVTDVDEINLFIAITCRLHNLLWYCIRGSKHLNTDRIAHCIHHRIP